MERGIQSAVHTPKELDDLTRFVLSALSEGRATVAEAYDALAARAGIA